jgi:TRAP-type mannitol/chloroaromatic compound transport system permease small subunit
MESMNENLGKVVKFSVLGIIVILLIEAIARFFFKQPTIWSIELSEFILGFYFMIAGGYTLLRGGHVKMDVLYSRWSARKQAIADAVTFPLLAIYLVLLVFGGIEGAIYAIEFNQRTFSPWHPPLAPIKIFLVIGGTILLLQGIAFLIKDIALIRRKEEAT